MAAVVVSHPAPERSLTPVPGRPHLRVLAGGRAARRPGRLHPAVYRRRRLVVLAVAVVLVAVAFLAVTGARTLLGGASAGPVAAASGPAAAPTSTHTYVVQPGDTLWAIARRLQPAGDVRPLVDRLAERVGGASLEAGQRLSVDGLTD